MIAQEDLIITVGRREGSCMTCGEICGETIGLSWQLVMFFLMLLYKDASAVNFGIFMMFILYLLSVRLIHRS
jgi:hypothetical protein